MSMKIGCAINLWIIVLKQLALQDGVRNSAPFASPCGCGANQTSTVQPSDRQFQEDGCQDPRASCKLYLVCHRHKNNAQDLTLRQVLGYEGPIFLTVGSGEETNRPENSLHVICCPNGYFVNHQEFEEQNSLIEKSHPCRCRLPPKQLTFPEDKVHR